VSGRVQVLQDPQGRAKNLEGFLLLLKEQRDAQIEEIEKRHSKAQEYLINGKLPQ